MIIEAEVSKDYKDLIKSFLGVQTVEPENINKYGIVGGIKMLIMNRIKEIRVKHK